MAALAPNSTHHKTLPFDTLHDNPSLQLPDLLLTYQKRSNKQMETARVCFIEKSRRIGLTWGTASDAVLTAAANKIAGGMDVFYIGFNLDMTREFIDTCASWAKSFQHAASAVDEFMFADDNEKEIKAFRITFDSGFEIVALTSRPRSLRGRQGYVIIDEAAFHDDLPGLMKAALALLMWGGKVLVISTHDGADNAFNQYIKDIEAGRSKYAHIKITLDDALAEGLYKRICLTRGMEWSEKAEHEWREELINFYGDGADEELFCIPRNSSGTFLPGTLVESRMVDTPVIRFSCDDEFVYKPETERISLVKNWCDAVLKPLLDKLDPKLQSFLGEDFGRNGDLTVLWILQLMQNMVRHTPFVVELSNVPFRQQMQIVWYILDALPRFVSSAFDARGNGSQLAEETMQRYGAGRVHCVMISAKWYLETMPKYKAALEDVMITIPRDADILADHRAAVMFNGVAQIPDKRTTGKSGAKRHGDSLIAAVMAHWASQQTTIAYEYTPLRKNSEPQEGRFDDDDDDVPVNKRSHRFDNLKGGF